MVFGPTPSSQRNICFLFHQSLRKYEPNCTFQNVRPLIPKHRLRRHLWENSVRNNFPETKFNILSSETHFKGLSNIICLHGSYVYSVINGEDRWILKNMNNNLNSKFKNRIVLIISMLLTTISNIPMMYDYMEWEESIIFPDFS